jgi:serine/threonine protein kinase
MRAEKILDKEIEEAKMTETGLDASIHGTPEPMPVPAVTFDGVASEVKPAAVDAAAKDPVVATLESLPAVKAIPTTLKLSDFSDVTHFADGTNASVYLAQWNGKTCIIKVIRKEKQNDHVAEHEFEVERLLLERCDHSDIISILGAGRDPRPFLVLEYLTGGTLKGLFDAVAKRSTMDKLFGKGPSFSFNDAILRGRDFAVALSHLHSALGKDVVLIHRDLKPDNVAFTGDGRLVLFDLGLSTVIRHSGKEDDTYEMTGQTGSLRYMAPEVMMSAPYNEKVDVYSFAIILWQMASGVLPYNGASRAEFVKYVGKLGERPELTPYLTWPTEFKDILVKCWHQDQNQRPSFDQVIGLLDSLIAKKKIASK